MALLLVVIFTKGCMQVFLPLDGGTMLQNTIQCCRSEPSHHRRRRRRKLPRRMCKQRKHPSRRRRRRQKSSVTTSKRARGLPLSLPRQPNATKPKKAPPPPPPRQYRTANMPSSRSARASSHSASARWFQSFRSLSEMLPSHQSKVPTGESTPR